MSVSPPSLSSESPGALAAVSDGHGGRRPVEAVNAYLVVPGGQVFTVAPQR